MPRIYQKKLNSEQAKQSTKILESTELAKLMSDINTQPDWRTLARRAMSYYDGDQLTPAVKDKLMERGQPITLHNLIKPTVDAVLGMEAKTRTALMVVADEPDDEYEELAEALNAEFADVCRLANLDRARQEAYKQQISAGLGWVEVVRNGDPFGPKYKIIHVHRDEVYWDWMSKEYDLSDARWLMRKRWLDVDEAKVILPGFDDIIDFAVNDWIGFTDTFVADGTEPELESAFNEYASFTRMQQEWLSRDRQRILLQVVYYRVHKRIQVLETESGQAFAYNKDNLTHTTLLGMGKAFLSERVIQEIREAWFIGPHKIGDRPCKAPYGMFPLVPFWGYRKDASGEPYGLIAGAIPAQDEVNFRRIKLTFLLQAKRVIMDTDATKMSRERVLEEVERPDGFIELNPERKNQKSISDVFKVEQDFNIAQQQFNVMQDSMKLIQDTMGVYAAYLGKESVGQSGVAIASLVEQGSTTLAEINDNYRFSTEMLGKLILGYLMEDLSGRRNYSITLNKDDKRKRKSVQINVQQEDGTLSNDITQLSAHIALAPIQTTSIYKQQLVERLTAASSQLPPQAQAAVFDLIAEMMDIPNKHKFLDRIRNALGVPKEPDEMTPEEQQAAQAQQQQQQQQQEMAMREIMAKIGKMEADIAVQQANAARITQEKDSARFTDAKQQAETGVLLQEMQAVATENERMKLELGQLQDQLLQNIQSQLDAVM